jgi:hypothetical protein
VPFRLCGPWGARRTDAQGLPEGRGRGSAGAERGRGPREREAFGRFASPAVRQAGAAVVRRYQHLGFGNWFLCDCLGPGRHPPALVPVLESFIRRHTDPPWPRHTDACDFHRDPPEQRAITQSYARPPAGPIRLLRRLPSNDESSEPTAPVPRFYSQRREALGTLLLQLVEKAGLNRVPADGKAPDLGEQYRRLRLAGHAIELDVDLPVSAYLCTYPPALPAFFDALRMLRRLGSSERGPTESSLLLPRTSVTGAFSFGQPEHS